MRNPLLLLCLLFPFFSLAQNDYFFSQSVLKDAQAANTFDPTIPTPESFLGYAIGDYHTRHDRMVSYMEKLAEVSPKATFQIIGHTNEQRAQVVLTITSPDNHNNLENIRQAHLNLAKPAFQGNAGRADKDKSLKAEHVIVLLGYNVHGNEPSSLEAAMLTAYYLVASQNPETTKFLQEAVIHIDPSYNPDGRDRHTHWANMHRAQPLVSDPSDAEHNESWPRGRTNHYWFDLNRDWLPLAQVESRNRMAFYKKWLPNVATDYHEMGTNATYFFEPTKKFGSENPLVGRDNYEKLNELFATYFTEALDDIGSLYYTEEVFDNSYPGYGSTYPDIHGGLGLVFEQASSRGHLQDTRTKPLSFAFTIRNHLRTGIATVRAAVENKQTLNDHMANFFAESFDQAKKRKGQQAVVFGDVHDKTRTMAFAKLLTDHHIKTYPLDKDVQVNGQTFKANECYMVPFAQEQYRMVSTMFDAVTEFHDSVFYDASAWTVAMAYNMPFQFTEKLPSAAKRMTQATDFEAQTPNIEKAKYAYLIDWRDYNAAKVLYRLLDAGVYVKTAFKAFTTTTSQGTQDMGAGTLLIAVADQNYSPDELHNKVLTACAKSNVKVYSVGSGRTPRGIDLGSNNFRVVQKPKVAMLIGDGTSGYETGEVWHLLDTKVEMPISKLYTNNFGRADLSKYNTLVLCSGSYANLGQSGEQKIKDWVQAGGTLIAIRNAVSWAIRKDLTKEKFIKDPKANDKSKKERRDFGNARNERGSFATGGSIYKTDVDISHPLAFGYTSRTLPVYRNHNNFLALSEDPYSTVIQYDAQPLLGGYVHKDNLKKIASSASLVYSPNGSGQVILFADNPNFRGFWFGTNKLFFNAVFWGGM